MSVLLIDDDEAVLDGLKTALEPLLPEVLIATWQPMGEDATRETFDQRLPQDTMLVVTDYDLTGQGARGLFGPTIVDWCRQLLLPVGDFSRGNHGNLPAEPDLFELRVPADNQEAALFIAATYKGFVAMRDAISEVSLQDADLAELMAAVLGRPHLESELSLYMSGFGSASLARRLQRSADAVSAATYALGHLMVNVVLKYPGTVLSSRALCAYMSTSFSEGTELERLFNSCRYMGPFHALANYFWREDVDQLIDGFAADDLSDVEDIGQLNRQATEIELGRQLTDHGCQRDECGGKRGGFYCPFTNRPVCLRSDCSTSSTAWIPDGASLARVEKEYYDEWAPLLGL